MPGNRRLRRRSPYVILTSAPDFKPRMRLSDRYVFGELILPFVIGTLAVLMMLVGNTLFAYLARMLQEKWPVGVVMRALVLNIPTVLVLTLPVATALAASLATNRMARDLEITVLRGSGASLLRIFLPILLFGALVSAADLYISDRVVPWAWKEQQNVESILYNLPKDPVQSNVAFKVENHSVYIGSAERAGPNRLRLNKIEILQHPDKPGEYPVITTAETAEYYADVWTLKNGVVHRYDKRGITDLDMMFEEMTLNLRVNFSQVLTPPLREDQLAFAELTQRAADARRLGQTNDALRYEVERWFKISLPAMCLVFALCAPPLALRFSRAGSFTGVLLSIIVVFVAWNTLLLMKYVGLGESAAPAGGGLVHQRAVHPHRFVAASGPRVRRTAWVLPLLLGGAALAQTPSAPSAAEATKPSLPAVPQETPHNTGPGISPATPGVNLDAPPPGVPIPPPPVTTPPGSALPAEPAEAPVPEDEWDFLILEEPAGSAHIDAERRITLEGNVRLRYRGWRVRADRATFEDNRRIATFEGNVAIETGQLPLYGDSLSLNLRTREFTFGDGRAVVPPPLMGPYLLQPLRVSGETLTRVGRDLVAAGGFLTTCDFPHPHYRFGFRKLTLIPNRRVAMRDFTLYLGERRVFRLPYLALPIREGAYRYGYLPEVGQTQEEGVYIRSALGYLLSDALPGILRLDLMQKKGIGLGFDQEYRFGAAAAGSLLLYGLRDQNRGVNNLSGSLNHRQELGDWAATIASTFQRNSYQALSPNSSSQLTTATVTRAAGGSNTSLSFNLSESDYGFGASGTSSFAFSQSERLGPAGSATFRLNGSRYETPGFGGAAGTTREDGTADLQATARVGVFDLELAANKNLAGSQGGGGFFSGTERLPEITLGTDTLRFARGWLAKLPLRITTGYGRFIEGGSERRETDRALLSLDASPGAIPLVGDLSLQLGGTLRQTVYSGDTAQYVLAGRSQLTQRLGGSSSLNLTYGYLRPYGFAPLRVDQSGSFNNAGANLALDGRRVRLSLLTGYDIQRAQSELPDPNNPGRNLPTNPWQNLAVQLALRPSGVFQTRFTGSFDINSGRLRDVTNRVRVRAGGGLALDTGLRYDPATGKFPQINGALESALFGGKWNLSALAGYNGFTRRFEYKNFALTRAWHDYELTLSYIDQPYGFRSEKGLNLLFRLKALPVYQRTGVGQFGTALDTGTGEVF